MSAAHDSSRAARTARLRAAREADSAVRRARVLAAIDKLATAGVRITVARLAREADVSTWLIYNVPEIRDVANAAITNQRVNGVPTPPAVTRTATPDSLRTDLALAREEIKDLRAERDRLRDRLRKTLGAEVEQATHEDLRTQVQQLEHRLEAITAERNAAKTDAAALRPQVSELQDQLEAQRDLNRDLMRQVNLLRSEP